MTIEENNAEVTETTEVNEESVEATEQDVSEQQEENSEQKQKQDAEEFVPFPKKAQNAISRRDRTIGKLQAKSRELEARLRQYEQNAQQAPRQQQAEDKGPQEKDFETYGEYVEARAEWRAEKKFEQRMAEFQKQFKEAEKSNQFTAEEQRYLSARTQEIDKKSAEYSQAIPDFDEMQEQNAEIVASFPMEIKRVMLEADDPALAFYNLAKDGVLVELGEMTPTQAAKVLALASHKSPLRKTTQAPKPMRGVSGVGATRSEDTMSGRELRKKAGLI